MYAYAGDNLSEIGIEQHEYCIDTALEQNPDEMIFPATLEAAGEEILEPGEDDSPI